MTSQAALEHIFGTIIFDSLASNFSMDYALNAPVGSKVLDSYDLKNHFDARLMCYHFRERY